MPRGDYAPPPGSSGGASTSAVDTAVELGVETHADRVAGTAIGGGDAAHGAVTSTSKIMKIRTYDNSGNPTGTGEFFNVAVESFPPTGVNIGDVWLPAVDGDLA